jgi:endogenous inhibitor of DNA gyrase (YacG/DUF329 family)
MNERYLVRGQRIDNGESVEGYYVYTCGDDKHWILKLGEYKREVEPVTVEPISVKPQKDEGYKSFKCPNCKKLWLPSDSGIKEGLYNYCCICGQRLDMSEWRGENGG